MAGSWAAIAAKGASVPAPAPVSSANIKASLEDTGTANKTSASTAGPPVLSEQEEALRSVKKVVLDSGAIIKGGRLESLGQKFWTIKEVLGEVKDSHARAVLDTLAVELEVREVDPAALAAVSQFAKLTGDYQRLSAVDLKVIALTYQMEKQYHGTAHLNSAPRPAVAAQKAPATKEHMSPAQTEASVQDECCEDEDDHETIDPSEFARVPLAEGDWKGGAADRDETSSVAGSEAERKARKPKKKAGQSSLPGWGEWDDGKDDDAGWITPDNVASSGKMDRVEKREDDDSHVACATLDGAMQNVLLQMGLRVVDTDGDVVKNVKQFVLKCHGCFAICHDTEKQFCPACGNATMMRVSKWVQADGRVTYSKGIKNFSVRGTKYTLPLPVQGRSKDDVVLREDQLLMSKHRQRKSKAVADDDGFTTLVPRDQRKNPSNLSDQDVIGMGYAGGGRRNPNERRRR